MSDAVEKGSRVRSQAERGDVGTKRVKRVSSNSFIKYHPCRKNYFKQTNLLLGAPSIQKKLV